MRLRLGCNDTEIILSSRLFCSGDVLAFSTDYDVDFPSDILILSRRRSGDQRMWIIARPALFECKGGDI